MILTTIVMLSPSVAWIVPRQASPTTGPIKVLGGAAAIAGGGLAAAFYAQKQRENKLNDPLYLYTPEPSSLKGQTILVTGGSSGLGLESAKRLAVGGANIVLTARSDKKGQNAVQQVQEYLRAKGMDVSDNNISYKILDLDDLQSVKDAVASWKDDENLKEINVLLNNAGIMALPNRELTVDGIERQMQSNHLGHFLLTALLAPKLAKDARIVNVSSEAHKFASGTGLLDYDKLWNPSSENYGAWKSYGQSKLANILFTRELQRRIDNKRSSPKGSGRDWTVVCLHPGAVVR